MGVSAQMNDASRLEPPETEPSGEERVDSDDSPGPMRDPQFLTIVAIAFELALIPTAWLLAKVWAAEGEATGRLDLDALRFGVLATLPLIAGLFLITWTPLRELRALATIRRRLRDIMGDAIARLRLWQIIAISTAAGIGEEILFRGVLQDRMGILGTSLLFGVLHAITLSYAVLAGLLGAYLGWTLIATENLAVPVIVHFLYDVVALLVIRGELRKRRP